jgi:SIR2-like domain
MAITLFLGAGFSKPWGMPIAREVMQLDDLKAKTLPGKWQRELISRVEAYWEASRHEHEGVVDRFAQALQSSPSDALSFSDFSRFIALRFSAHHWKVGTARETKWATGDHIRKQRKISKCYDQFLKALRGRPLTGIVTTNYDLVVEKLLGPEPRGRLGGFNYGKAGESVEGRHPLSSKWSYGPIQLMGKIPLLKLHGSLNWASSSDGSVIKYVDARPSRGRRFEAVLLPPGLSEAPILTGVRDLAKEVLTASNIWIFCGYSMPDYDKDIISLLRSSAVGQLRRVIALAPNSLKVAQQLERVIGLQNGDSASSIKYLRGPGLSPELTERELVSLMGFNGDE